MLESTKMVSHHAALRLVVDNSFSGNFTPRSWQSLKRRKWMRSGKAFSRFQFETADGLTSKSRATAAVPPRASMTSLTSIPDINSNWLNFVNWLDGEQTSRAVNGNIRTMKLLNQDKPRSVDAISERLELTRRALGMTQRAFALNAGLTPPAYNNWKKGLSRPDLDAAFMLCDAYGLTIEWVYEGDASRLPAQLVEKLRKVIAQDGKTLVA